jgi:hypothetical protein
LGEVGRDNDLLANGARGRGGAVEKVKVEWGVEVGEAEIVGDGELLVDE